MKPIQRHLSPGEEKPRTYPHMKELFVNPIKSQLSAVLIIFISLIFLSLSQTIFLLLIGPLLKSLFSVGSVESSHFVSVSALVPGDWEKFVPQLKNWKIKRDYLVTYIPIVIFLTGLVKASATYLFSYHQQLLSVNIATNYRKQLFSSLLRQPFIVISRQSAGEWMSTIMNDVMYLQSRFSAIMGGLIKESILIISSYLVMFVTHWPTALVVLACSPLFAISLGRSGKRISFYAESWQKLLSQMSSLLLSVRQRFVFVRAQRGELRELELFEKLNHAYLLMIRSSLPIRAAMAPLSELAGFFAFALLIFLIHKGYWLNQQQLGGLELVQFFAAMALLVKPLKSIGEQVASYHETKGALSKSLAIFAGLSRRQDLPTIENKKHELSIDRSLMASNALSKHTYLFKSLKLSYGEQTRFEAKELGFGSKECIAVIGPSGGGKSTLVKFFAGLLNSDEVKISRSDGHQVKLSEFNRICSLVSQRPFLFEDSLRRNLCYGLSENNLPTDDHLWQLLDQFALGDLVRSRPLGLDTHLGSLQGSLSGGQEQRLTIIRALLQPHRGLLLDEATSALDQASDELVSRYILDHSKRSGVFVFFVTHRLHDLDRFDRVLFIERGRIVFFDTHQNLLKQPRYKAFVQDQCI